MSNVSNPKHLYQNMSVSTLKAFVFFIFPFAFAGQVFVILSKFSEGMLETNTLGLPNVAIQLCCLATIGAMTVATRSCWQELRTRSKG